jgi:asparagine synthase (glutamine-hydrolysing)
MCGIAGHAGSRGGVDVEAAIGAMRHRGPDARGFWREVRADGTATAFGHARLSIVDLSDAANQPFVDDDGDRVIVFNGEIYNHVALRDELRALGHVFRTRSDTEVLLRAWTQWGEGCLPRLDGMFAFAIHDRRDGSVALARDSYGIKPLYWSVDAGGGLAFASEVRGLAVLLARRFEPDPACFAEFLLNGFLYEPSTGLLGVHKLPPGGVARWSPGCGGLEPRRWDDPRRRERGAIDAAIRRAVGLQLLADVRVGLFFSGGVDSTVLALAAATPPEALFVDYDASAGAGDAPFAREIAARIGLPLKVVTLSSERGNADHVLEEFRRVAAGTEEPISDYTYVAAEAIAREARATGCKVMLSGMGGDELFGGYPRHRAVAYASMFRGAARLARPFAPALRRTPGLAKKLDRFLRFAGTDDFGLAYTSLVGYFGDDEVAALLGDRAGIEGFASRLDAIDRPSRSLSPLHRAMQLDRAGFLAHNLTVTDRSSMAQSIEVRVPLLTPELGALSAGLGDADLLDLRHGKKPLRAMMLDRLPRAVVDRRKIGFNPPLDARIATVGADRLRAELRTSALGSVVDLARVDRLVSEHFAGEANHAYRLWQLVYFGFWLDSTRAHPSPGTGAAR